MLNREVKFRAWIVKEKRMMNGAPRYLVFTKDGTYRVGGVKYHVDKFKVVRPIKKGEYILMQYTGLKDKNGKEIFEGDIVKFSAYNPVRIEEIVWGGVWGYLGFGVQHKSKQQEKGYTWFQLTKESGSKWNRQFMEVIGNIYENPELLEDKC